MKRLIEIQQELKAPKGQRNNFGNYNYRSCEDILEAVKPLLKKQGLALIISDEICNIGERYYIRAVAQLFDGEKTHDNLIAETVAYAREEESKKGMDASQITGSTSSYARKYALNGLFAIDDTKDADATNTHGKPDKKPNADFIPDVIKNQDEPKVSTASDLEIMKGVSSLLSEDACTDYWNENVSKLSGATARKSFAELIKKHKETLKKVEVINE